MDELDWCTSKFYCFFKNNTTDTIKLKLIDLHTDTEYSSILFSRDSLVIFPNTVYEDTITYKTQGNTCCFYTTDKFFYNRDTKSSAQFYLNDSIIKSIDLFPWDTTESFFTYCSWYVGEKCENIFEYSDTIYIP
jgi:hypothetical protein